MGRCWGFLLHFCYCDLLSLKDKKSVSLLDFRTDHRVSADSVWSGNKKPALLMMYHVVTHPSRKMFLLLLYALIY